MGPLTDPAYEKAARDYGGAFMKGANANSYAANATNCFDRILNTWFYELPTMQWRYFYGNFDDNVFNTTHEMANMTNTMMVCFDVT